MNSLQQTLKLLERLGFGVDDASIERAIGYASALRFLEERVGQWTEDEATGAREFRANLEWLSATFGDFSEEDMQAAAAFRADLEWLEIKGRSTWNDDDAQQVATLSEKSEVLERSAEAAPVRPISVAQLAAALRKRKRRMGRKVHEPPKKG